jgi:hypothetical protein
MPKRLGRRHTDRSRPVLRMGAHLTTAAFQTPTQVDYAKQVPTWLLGANDRYGTCGPTAVANYALLVTSVLGGAPVQFTDEEIFDLYRRCPGNQDFDGKTKYSDGSYVGDNGVDMTELLSELVKNGIGFGPRNVKAVAFGALNAFDIAETWAAGATFGGTLLGMDLDQAQSRQFDKGQVWDYTTGSPSWGGHAVLAAHRYSDVEGTSADRTALVTWGEMTDASDAFFSHQVPESYAVIWPWHLTDKQFLTNVDLPGIAAEFTSLTGRSFPVPVAPPVEPAPNKPKLPFPTATWEEFVAHPFSIPKRRAVVEAINAYRENL